MNCIIYNYIGVSFVETQNIISTGWYCYHPIFKIKSKKSR